MDFQLPVSYGLLVRHCHWFRWTAGPHKYNSVFGIALLSSLKPEIYVLPVWRPPS